MHKAWFPNGPDDPKLALLKVEVDQAEYWDGPSSTMVQLIGFAKATLTGQRYIPGETTTSSIFEPAPDCTEASGDGNPPCATELRAIRKL